MKVCNLENQLSQIAGDQSPLGGTAPQRYCPSISDTCRQENGDGNREAVKKHGRARQRHKPMLLALADEVIE